MPCNFSPKKGWKAQLAIKSVDIFIHMATFLYIPGMKGTVSYRRYLEGAVSYNYVILSSYMHRKDGTQNVSRHSWLSLCLYLYTYEGWKAQLAIIMSIVIYIRGVEGTVGYPVRMSLAGHYDFSARYGPHLPRSVITSRCQYLLSGMQRHTASKKSSK